ncbi:hypothetical protein Emag_002500 [Eimeria magna]
MAAVKNHNAAVAPVLGEGQRRLLLEVLRANLRAKNGLPVLGVCGEQPVPTGQPGARERQHPQSSSSLVDRCAVASAVSGGSALHPALAEGLGSSVAAMEVDTHAVGQETQPVGAAAGVSGSDGENAAAHVPRSCAADGGVPASGGSHVSKSSSGLCVAGSEEQRGGSSGGEGDTTQQGLTAALFSRLSDSLPRDQGDLHFLTWADGSCYCGHLTAGSLDGVGVYRYPDDSIYCGQWVRDHLQGQGAFITTGGFVYRGGFEADKQHGAGILVVPSGKTFFGSFRNGRLHGLSCCVSSCGMSRAILGEWRDGEFQKVFPLNSRVADFYIRIADSVDLLGGCWLPLAIPFPEAFSAAADEGLGTGAAHAPQQRLQQLPRASMMEALRTELPTSLLQVAAASAQEESSIIASRVDRHPNARLACPVKAVVRKRKVGLCRPHARDNRDASAAAKGRCLLQEGGGGGSHGGAAGGGPQRAATTKAQLLRWESEARKLPRIPHLNYNRVLGRWYARVRDPASGRRIWKGYTCAVHGFYQARDMAIDRLRQFSQLVSPLGSNGEPEHAGPAEDQQTPTAGDAATSMDRNDMQGTASAATMCTDTADAAPTELRRSATAALEGEMEREDGAVCSSDALACETASALLVDEEHQSEPQQSAAAEAKPEEELAVALPSAKTGREGLLNEIRGVVLVPPVVNQEEGGTAAAAASLLAPASHKAQRKQHLCSAGEQQQQQAAHAFATDEAAAEACCRDDTLLSHDGESFACSRLTTADCESGGEDDSLEGEEGLRLHAKKD